MSNASFQEISETDEFRQGDIIRPYDETRSFSGLPAGSAGVIVTADCDIANDKYGDYLSYLPIVPADSYLDSFWAPPRLERITFDACKQVIDTIYKTEKKRDSDVHRLSQDEFLDWFRGRGASAILNLIPLNAGQEKETASKQLAIIEAALQRRLNTLHPNIACLKSCWKLKGFQVQKQIEELKKGIADLTNAVSFFLIPELPDSPPYGHVVTIRDVRSINADNIFASRRAVPYHRRDDSCMYRVGRFSDRIRFAISQKLASLFSRIGMTSHFEADCKVVPDLVIASLFPDEKKDQPIND
jgi:hypothetical protein